MYHVSLGQNREPAAGRGARQRRSRMFYLLGSIVGVLAAYGVFVLIRPGDRRTLVRAVPSTIERTAENTAPPPPATTYEVASLSVPTVEHGAQGVSPEAPPPHPEAPLEKLRASGASREPWTDKATTALRKLLQSSQPGVDLRDVSCFHDGCVASAVFADLAAFEEVNHAVPNSTEFVQWPGDKGRSPPSPQSDGRVVAHWVFYRPNQ